MIICLPEWNPKKERRFKRIPIQKLNRMMSNVLKLSSLSYLFIQIISCVFVANNCFWFPKEKGADLRSTEGHYDSSKTIPEVNLGRPDPLSQGHTDQSSINKPVDSMLSLVEESANDPAEENMMVVRVGTQSQIEALSILSTSVPDKCQKLNQPLQSFQVKKLMKKLQKALQNHPLKPKESTPTLSPAPSKINLAPEDVAALMMMAQITSYIPKESPMPSFSLGLTDLEQLGELMEKIASSGVKTEGKSPQIQKQRGEESFEKFETPARTNEMSTEMKEKWYIWAIHMKTYGDGSTNEYDTVYTLNAQDRYILSKVHFASLKADTHIEVDNMAVENHPNGEFLQPKTNKPFKVEDYPMFIPFLDLKKLASHPYDEVDHYRVEYASRILFHEMNQDKGEVIRESDAIRLSKPSSLLLSPYCQIDSNDIDTV
ncbi:hypothetical protein AHAS_Ahas06G0139100 [Arachis hypogaea]